MNLDGTMVQNIPDVNTGPFACPDVSTGPFACPLTHSLTSHGSLGLLVRSLAHPLILSESKGFDGYFRFFFCSGP